MSFRAKRELLIQVAPRYREATHVLGDYGPWKPLLD